MVPSWKARIVTLDFDVFQTHILHDVLYRYLSYSVREHVRAQSKTVSHAPRKLLLILGKTSYGSLFYYLVRYNLSHALPDLQENSTSF